MSDIKKPHSPRSNNIDKDISKYNKLQKVLEQKKETFYHLSEQLFDINQDYLINNQYLKSLEKYSSELLKKYLDITVEITQHEADLMYKYEDIQLFNSKTNDMTSANNQDVEYYRTELVNNLKLYQESRKQMKYVQMECNEISNNSHIDSLNFIEFCKYSHNVQVDQLNKFSMIESLPSKDNLKKSKLYFKKQLQLSTKQFYKFYLSKIEEFQRKERILIGKAKNDFEQLQHSNNHSNIDEQNNNNNNLNLNSIEEIYSNSNIIANHLSSSNSNDDNNIAHTNTNTSTNYDPLIDSYHSLENKFANELMIALSNHNHHHHHKSQQHMIKDTRHQLLGINKQLQISSTLPAIQSAINEKVRNTILNNRVTILKSINDPTPPSLTSHSRIYTPLSPNTPKKTTTGLVNRESMLLLGKNDTSKLSKNELNTPTNKNKSSTSDFCINNDINNDMMSNKKINVKITKENNITNATNSVTTTMTTTLNMKKSKKGTSLSSDGNTVVHSATNNTNTNHNNASNIIMNKKENIEPETITDTIDLLNEDLYPTIETSLNTNNTTTTNTFPTIFKKHLDPLQGNYNLSQYFGDKLFDINNFLYQCDIDKFPQGALINHNSNRSTSSNMKIKSNNDNNNMHNNNKKSEAELLTDIAKQLCAAEGKFRTLNSIKEGLDLHLIKQAHVLILLIKDLFSEIGCRLPESLCTSAIKIEENILNKSFSSKYNMNQTSMGGAISGRYRIQINKNIDIELEKPYSKLETYTKYNEQKLNELLMQLNTLLHINEIQENINY